MKTELIQYLVKTAKNIGITVDELELEYPENSEHGDYSSNIAMAHAKSLKMAPKVLAEKIIEEFKKDMPVFVEGVSVAGPGFINFKIKDAIFAQAIVSEVQSTEGSTSRKNILIEYTDPNIFKVFHIGHLMSNAIGEALSRLIEYSGANVTRLCYPSDIGLHIAKSIWAMQKHESEIPSDKTSIQEKTNFLGKMYVEGTQMYETDVIAKVDIDALNKTIYEKSNLAVNNLYDKGRAWSLEHFELLYTRLGTHFDGYLYESEMAPIGLQIVKIFAKKKIFKKSVFCESDGAIVFKGEDYGLHTRVFINSHGLPTYEAKEMGLNVTKFKKYPKTDQSIVVTASEQNEYFKVVSKALTLIDKNVGDKTKHIGHGMLRFASGKMSSRTGKVITAETLIDDIKALVLERIKDREFSASEAEEVSDMIAIAAIKYTILRQAVGSDVIFDSAKSISFEGDSGPYLQYSVVRARAVIEKAGKEGVGSQELEVGRIVMPEKVGSLEKLIVRFSDITERASAEYAPQHVANYLINLAGAFNSFYASNTIVDVNEPLSPYRVELTKKFIKVMTDGLHILGIKIPSKM